jgi:hypothetical protein
MATIKVVSRDPDTEATADHLVNGFPEGMSQAEIDNEAQKWLYDYNLAAVAEDNTAGIQEFVSASLYTIVDADTDGAS